MFNDPKGPIEHFSWGKYIIRGNEHSISKKNKVGAGKDIRLIGKDVSEWKERKGHRLTPDMITGVDKKDMEILIIGIGVNGDIVHSDDVPNTITEQGIGQVIFEKTPTACKMYNTLYHEGKRVALLAHGTC